MLGAIPLEQRSYIVSKRDKRLGRIEANPKAVSFSDLCSALEAWGFVIRSGKGSHCVAAHRPSGTTITMAKRNPMKRVYVENALEAIRESQTYTLILPRDALK